MKKAHIIISDFCFLISGMSALVTLYALYNLDYKFTVINLSLCVLNFSLGLINLHLGKAKEYELLRHER